MAHAISFTDHATNVTSAQGFVARLIKGVSDYRRFLAIHAELESLSDRSLEDMGLTRSDVSAVARESVYGA